MFQCELPSDPPPEEARAILPAIGGKFRVLLKRCSSAWIKVSNMDMICAMLSNACCMCVSLGPNLATVSPYLEAMSESGLESDCESLESDIKYLRQLQEVGEQLWWNTDDEVKDIGLAVCFSILRFHLMQTSKLPRSQDALSVGCPCQDRILTAQDGAFMKVKEKDLPLDGKR